VKIALLTDFGSTFTKVSAVDLAGAALVGLAQAPTSLDGEILNGYDEAARSALREVSGNTDVVLELAASSAGGGLRMVAVGLVASMTTSAAKVAALNAGARLIGTLSGELTDEHASCLASLAPEIVLFAGGTDGGQRTRVLRNAEALTGSVARSHVVVACNSDISEDVRKIFYRNARSATVVPNVMPHVGVTCFDEAREAVAQIFIRDVIAGKQLSRSPRFRKLVRMATPDAVLRAASLHASSQLLTSGDGALVTDVGGATTDVYSVLRRNPASAFGTKRTEVVGSSDLRTVEGDLGLRSSAPGTLLADRNWLERKVAPYGWLVQACMRRTAQPQSVFASGRERDLDEHLAVSCMFRALERHCGDRSVRLDAGGGSALVERGRNLSGCRVLIAGGGVLRVTQGAEELVRRALGRVPDSALAPRRCQVILDRRCVLAAAGLLTILDPQLAANLLRRELAQESANESQ
jgi:uncharacterized protein (TIGR01319 family)